MTRIIVAAANRSLSLGLAGLDYDVVDVDPDELDSWSASTQDASVLVVGVDDPVEAMELVRSVDQLRPGMPSLVVCSNAQGWSALPADGLKVEMLPLPVTRTGLIDAIERLTAPAAATLPPPAPPTAPESPAAAEPARPALEPVPTEPPTTDTPAPARRIVAARSTSALRERLANTSSDHATRSAPTVDHELEQLRPHLDTREAPAPPATEPPSSASPPAPSIQPPRAEPVRTASARDLVQALLGRRHELYDVRDAARAVLDECASVADVLAAVVMLPDNDVWRVVAALGARPLEWRYVLEVDSWIVTTVVDGDRGVVVEDSDIARQRLGGAPLAHHTQLMILPIPGPRGVILLARESEPFTETELTSLAPIAADAGPVLIDGLATRELARSLSEFRGVEE